VVYSVHVYFATGDDILAIVQHSDIHVALSTTSPTQYPILGFVCFNKIIRKTRGIYIIQNIAESCVKHQVTLSHIIASSTPRQKKDAFAKITSWIRRVVYSVHVYFATGDDILAIVQHSDIHGAPFS
jgi:hypothetical protein